MACIVRREGCKSRKARDGDRKSHLEQSRVRGGCGGHATWANPGTGQRLYVRQDDYRRRVSRIGHNCRFAARQPGSGRGGEETRKHEMLAGRIGARAPEEKNFQAFFSFYGIGGFGIFLGGGGGGGGRKGKEAPIRCPVLSQSPPAESYGRDYHLLR